MKKEKEYHVKVAVVLPVALAVLVAAVVLQQVVLK